MNKSDLTIHEGGKPDPTPPSSGGATLIPFSRTEASSAASQDQPLQELNLAA